MPTFFSTPNTLDADQYLPCSYFMSTVHKVLQCDEPIQLFIVFMTQWGLAQDPFITLLLHQEVAAIVSLGKYRSDKRSMLQYQRIRFGVRDMGSPNRY